MTNNQYEKQFLTKPWVLHRGERENKIKQRKRSCLKDEQGKFTWKMNKIQLLQISESLLFYLVLPAELLWPENLKYYISYDSQCQCVTLSIHFRWSQNIIATQRNSGRTNNIHLMKDQVGWREVKFPYSRVTISFGFLVDDHCQNCLFLLYSCWRFDLASKTTSSQGVWEPTTKILFPSTPTFWIHPWV